MNGPLIDLDTLRNIDIYLEEIYPASVITGERLTILSKAQISNLENIVNSATRFSEVTNFIKNQAGKDTKNTWKVVAKDILVQLREIEEKAKELGDDDQGRILDIKLRLVRGWVRQVATHYLYKKQEEERL